ncbi:MAG: lipopolysaccharide biosynthesis protein [Bacteroidales bacterium]|nr:lipopolysaccharide biosynthesis protein [Bacteroidales bacterium]
MSRVTSGIAWSSIERFSTQGISFIISIILARIIAPDQYGLIAMIQVFLSIAQIFVDGGFANALIQKQDRNETDYITVYIFNFVVAALIYLLLFVCAPFIAAFYEQPKLVQITRLLSLNLIFSSLSIVQRAKLTIALDFKTQTKVSLIAVTVSGVVGLICAYSGFEVWALVIQGLSMTLLTSVLLMVFSKWTPSSHFSWESFKTLFSFGSKLMGSNLINSIYLNLYNLTIGKFYPSAQLAYYNRAFNISLFPSVHISTLLNRIIYPLECEVQNDLQKLRETVRKYLHFTNFIVLPLMTLLLVLAKPLIVFLLTDKWLPTVPLLQIYCINFMLYPFMDQSGLPLAAVGKSDLILKMQFLKRAFSILVLVLTIKHGLTIICWGVVLSSLFETLVNAICCHREIKFKLRDQIVSQLDIIGSCAVAGVVSYFISQLFDKVVLQLFVGGAIGITVYLILAFLLNMDEKRYVKIAINKVKSVL